ncbi:serine hydrolase domain-containing protein [candidate division KSB1 bacterium]
MRHCLIYTLALLLIIPLFWTGCYNSTAPEIVESPVFIPQQIFDGWQTASLESVGMEPDSMESLIRLVDNTHNHLIHSILIVRNSKLVFEKYWDGWDVPTIATLNMIYRHFDTQTLHFQASVSKSFTSALVGIALDKGYISSVEDKVFSYFPDYADLKNYDNEKISIKQMLAMSSGYDWNEFVYDWSDPRDSHFQLFISEDPIQYLLGRPVERAPGMEFHYNSGDTNILGEIVRRSTSSDNLSDFAETYLFEPLGIEYNYWQSHPLAEYLTFASGGLFLRPRDMAKFGQLYLNEGVWNGRQVISSSWVDASIKQSIPLISNSTYYYGYGYQWWLGQFTYDYRKVNFYLAYGWGGQCIFVIPELDMVIIHCAGGYFDSPPVSYIRIIEDYILKAVRY